MRIYARLERHVIKKINNNQPAGTKVCLLFVFLQLILVGLLITAVLVLLLLEQDNDPSFISAGLCPARKARV